MSEHIERHIGSDEVWKPVRGFVGKYEISSWGNVRSVRTLKNLATSNCGGYRHIRLSGGSARTKPGFLVHCLVADAFLGRKPVGLQVNHIDGQKTNNHVSNLGYVTQSQNMRHAMRLGLHNPFFCRNVKPHSLSKLTDGQVIEIRMRSKVGPVCFSTLAREYGMSRQCMTEVVKGRSYRRVVDQ